MILLIAKYLNNVDLIMFLIQGKSNTLVNEQLVNTANNIVKNYSIFRKMNLEINSIKI